MRLLLVNYEFPPIGGGASTASWYIGCELVRQGHEVTVLTSAYKGVRNQTSESGMEVVRIPCLRNNAYKSNMLEMCSFVWAAIRHVETIAIEHNIEGTLIFFAMPCGPIGYWLWKQSGVPYVVSLRGGDVPGFVPGLGVIHSFIGPLRRLVLKRAWGIGANSKQLALLAEREDSVLCSIVPNGVDIREFGISRGTTNNREDDVFRILFVGRLSPQKNLNLFFDNVAQLKKITDRSIEVQIVGDGSSRNELQKSVCRLGLDDIVYWLGWMERTRLREIYRQADCFVNPSLYEGIPNTVLEAMASGLAVIGSDIDGHREVIVNEATGILVPLVSRVGFAHALRRLSEDPELCRRMGEAGRERVAEHYTWTNTARRYADMIREAVERGNRRAAV